MKLHLHAQGEGYSFPSDRIVTHQESSTTHMVGICHLSMKHKKVAVLTIALDALHVGRWAKSQFSSRSSIMATPPCARTLIATAEALKERQRDRFLTCAREFTFDALLQQRRRLKIIRKRHHHGAVKISSFSTF